MAVMLTIPGRPVPCVRMTQRGKFVKPQAQRYLAYKESVGWIAKVSGAKIITGPVEVRMIFFFANNKLPDLDNLIKAILDALNGICWIDDRQVVEITAKRTKGETEQAVVIVQEAG